MGTPKKVVCIKDVRMDGRGKVFTAGKSYQLIVGRQGNYVKTLDDVGQEHVVGKNFTDPWLLENFKVVE